jgi:hypothetical protein
MILSLLAAATIASTPSALPADVQRGFDTTVAMRHLRAIAHDTMKGRDSPSPQLELAADYIINELRAAGVKPIHGSYEHHYKLERVNLDTTSSMYLRKGASVTDFEIKKDFIPFERTGDVPIRNARVVFAGYGIDAPEYGYNDYDGLNVRGAVVLVIRGEPERADDTTWFEGRRPTRYAYNGSKARTARQYGAIGVLVVDRIRTGRKPVVSGWPWPSLFPAMPVSSLPLASVDTSDRLPLVHVGTRFIEQIADSLGALVHWANVIDSTKAPHRVDLGDARVSLSVQLHRTPVPLRNVMGMIPAATPTDEYVVMGAHYDHIGVGKPVAGDSVYNGADDNGSGTSSLLMAAQAMGRATSRPSRNIVVVFFSAEEKGLLGSKAYTANSPLPLQKCVAMLNTDMIGRLETNEVAMGGLARCPDLAAMNEEERQRLGLSFTLNGNAESYFFRSDQANFAMKRIPVLFYFTGEHSDYHKLGDEIHKINASAMVDIMKLATATAWRAAERPRTTYIPAGFEDAD